MKEPNKRQDYRNGYYQRNLVTIVGTLTLKVHRLRNDKLNTEIFSRYQRNEQVLLPVLMEMVVSGYQHGKLKK